MCEWTNSAKLLARPEPTLVQGSPTQSVNLASGPIATIRTTSRCLWSTTWFSSRGLVPRRAARRARPVARGAPPTSRPRS